MLLCRQASMSNHGEEKITPKRRKRRRCIAEESSSSNSDWGSAHPDREPESDRGARAGAQNGFPRQPRHHPGPHPAVACDQRWHRDVRDGPDRPRRGSGEVPFVCGVRWRRLVWGFLVTAVVEETARPAISLSLSTSPPAGTLASDGAPTQASNCLTLRICCSLGPESSLLMWLVQVKTKRPQPSHTWI